MKCTVLGGSGFIGRNLDAYLRREGHHVWNPLRNDTSVFSRSLGTVFYCIGVTADFRTRPFDTMRSHVCLLADLLEKADFTTLVYLSSTRVYARNLATFEHEKLVVDPPDSSDLYNLSKLAGESLCHCYKQRNVKIVRLSNVIGKDSSSDNFMSALIRGALSGHVVLRSAPESCKDYIWIDDVVQLLTHIALEGKHTMYNVASGKNLLHKDIVSRLSSLTGCHVDVLPDAVPQIFPGIAVDRICEEFAFVPKPVLEHLDCLVR